MLQGEQHLQDLGFDAHFQAALATLQAEPELTPARIAIAHGESYVAWTATGVTKAVIVGHRSQVWRAPADRPQVGDWVAGRQVDSATLLIEHLLPRATCLMRRAAGERLEAQVIAANIHVVGVVSALHTNMSGARAERLINEARLQRYLAAIQQSGAKPLLIVNKCDLREDAADMASGLRQAFPDVPLLLTSGAQAFGLDAIAEHVATRETLALVGMSGVGKSTLVNALLGRQTQAVQAVRSADARGRHTTTHRELFRLESGALLIDTPGMRELGLWDPEEAAASGGKLLDSERHARGESRARRSRR
jgi:ribosome biogenesis GTPase / thiamine phosphate phosphatase